MPSALEPTRRTIDEYVAAFERRRTGDESASLAEFLPGREHPLYLQVLRELVRVDLELGWEHGKPRPLSDYRKEFPELFADPTSLAEVAFEEYRLRREAGQVPAPTEYANEYGVNVNHWPTLPPPAASRPKEDEPTGSLRSLFLAELSGSDPETAGRIAAGLRTMPVVGDQFLGFELVEELGRGGFARVFLAREDALAGRWVALKVAPDLGGESQTLAQLQHTHIVPIHSVHIAGSLQAVCMPYFGRVTLADVLRDISHRNSLPQSGSELFSTLAVVEKQKEPHGAKPGIPPALEQQWKNLERLSYVEAVLWLVSCLADGLAHAHERGILHRDLKPANVLLTDEGLPMLLDFNLSEDTKVRDTVGGAMLGGTLPYMAPEHLEAFRTGQGVVDARSDIYALGIILYELLTGRAPFRETLRRFDPNPLGGMISERSRLPASPRATNPVVSPATAAIVMRCLAPDPTKRYLTARELKEDLQRQLEHRPLRYAPEPSLRERGAKWLQRNPGMLGRAAMAAGVFLLILLGWFAFRLSDLMARQTAQQMRDRFHAESREAQFLLSTRADEAEQREKGSRLAREALGYYGVLGDGWETGPLLVGLPAAEQEELRAEFGELLFLLGQVEQSLPLNERAEACFPVDTAPPALWFQRAELLEKQGDREGAKTARQRGQSQPPRTSRDYCLAAREHVAAERYRDAVPGLIQATQLDPRNFWAWFLLGACRDALGEDAQAESAYSLCISLAPDFHGAYFNRGLARLRNRDYPGAAADFDRVIALTPGLPEAYINRALARQGMEQYQAAIDDLTAALDRGATATRIYFLRARAREKTGDREGARMDQQEGMRREPTDERSWVARGVARMRQSPDAALADFEKALALNPHSRIALQNKAHVLAEKLGRPDDAIRVLDQAVALYPEYVPARVGRGVVHARLQHREAALADAGESLARDPRAPNRYRVACIYALLSARSPEDRATAIRLLTDAINDGYGADLLARDHDLDALREVQEFRQLLTAVATLRQPPKP